MGGPYNIPRDYKGESKILYVFSVKSFVYTAVGGLIGVGFNYIFNFLGISKIGIICIILLAGIGFIISSFKVPNASGLKFTIKTAGEPIDEVISRWIKFKKKKNRIYIYKEEEEENVK